MTTQSLTTRRWTLASPTITLRPSRCSLRSSGPCTSGSGATSITSLRYTAWYILAFVGFRPPPHPSLQGGKGRTGTVICAYLIFVNRFQTPDESFAYFATKRSAIEKGVTQPSQKRCAPSPTHSAPTDPRSYISYVRYFSQIIQNQIFPKPKVLTINKIMLVSVPGLCKGKSGCNPVCRVYAQTFLPKVQLFSSSPKGQPAKCALYSVNSCRCIERSKPTQTHTSPALCSTHRIGASGCSPPNFVRRFVSRADGAIVWKVDVMVAGDILIKARLPPPNGLCMLCVAFQVSFRAECLRERFH